MRDKVTSNNLKILIVCPSHTYDSIDRKALLDSQFIRDIGGNPTLYCLKSSYVEKEAEKLALPRILYRGFEHKRFFPISFFLDMRKVLKEDWDIVHCYNLNALWSIAFLLLAKNKTSLFLTINQFLKSYTYMPYYSWLLKRVDTVFALTKSTADNFAYHFQFPKRKVKIPGMGVESFAKKTNQLNEEIRIGTFLNNEKELDNFRTLLFSIKPVEEKLIDKKITIKAFTFKPIKDFYDYSFIQKYIHELGLTNKVEFIISHRPEICLKQVDFLVSLSFTEPVSDFEIQSLMSGIPVILPRTAARRDLLNLNSDNRLCRTFAFQDAGAMRKEMLTIINDYENTVANLHSSHKELSEHHEIENYALKIHSSYEIAVEKRNRLFGRS